MSFFSEDIINEIKCMPDNLDILFNRLLHEDNIGIWGTGIAGKMVFKAAKKRGIQVGFFVDGMKNNAECNFKGVPVFSPSTIPRNAFILIAADVKYGIHRVLEKDHVSFCYVDPFLFSQYTCETKKEVCSQITAAHSEIDAVYNRFRDELSRKTFHNVLLHRANHQINLIWSVFDHNQYFNNDVIQTVSGCFVDCGAYTGDTLKAFLSQNFSEYYYYAFEPEQKNYAELKRMVEKENLTNVSVFPIGLWNKKTKLHFLLNDINDTLAWSLEESSDPSDLFVHVDTLDNLLRGIQLNFIKMDIEGAEIKALEGSKECVKKYTPQLAISAYHQLDHLWKVPQKILDLDASYELYFRHHSWNIADSVCYGI